MSDILSKIVAQKLEEIVARKAQRSQSSLQAELSEYSATRGFKAALLEKISRQESAVIAEIKKASPSKGLIRDDFKPSSIAEQYQSGGATCLSVLTDEQFFQGHDDYLVAARAACTLPVLRKDFVVDEYQIYEARSLGADCILLIVSILDDAKLSSFHELGRSLGMNILVEVHDEEELERALEIQPDILGVNNRNLKTFEVSLDTTIRLDKMVPKGTPIITESGIHTAEDVARMHSEGIFGFLVGEAFMRQEDPGSSLSEIFASG